MLIILCSSYISGVCIAGCGYCKNVKPEFESAAETLSGHDNQALAAIDCTEFSGQFYCFLIVLV